MLANLYITLLSLSLPDAVVPGPGLQLWVPEGGMMPKQEIVTTITTPLNIYVRIP